MSKNLSRRLFELESGVVKSIKFRNEICWKRTNRLELSRCRDVVVVGPGCRDDDREGDEGDAPRGHSAAVTALDLDGQEFRYLLAGCADGSLYIHDLANLAGVPRTSSRLVGRIKPIPAPQLPVQLPSRALQASRHQRPTPVGQDGHFQSVQTVQWYSGDSALFTSSGMDERLLVWDSNSLKIAEEFKLNKLIFCHQMSQPPSALVAVASASNHVRLIDLKSGSSTHELRGHSDSVLTVRWSGSRDHLLASGCHAGQVLLWDVRRARSCLHALDLDNISKQRSDKQKSDSSKRAHCGSTNGLAFCDDGLHLISFGGHEAKLRRWDLSTGRNTKTPFVKLQKRNSSNKNKICSKISLTPSFGRRDGVVFVPEGSNVAAVDVNSGKVTDRLRGHFHGVHCTVFNDQDQELYSGGGDRNILVWDSNREQVDAYEDDLKVVGDVDHLKQDDLFRDGWSSSSSSSED